MYILIKSSRSILTAGTSLSTLRRRLETSTGSYESTFILTTETSIIARYRYCVSMGLRISSTGNGTSGKRKAERSVLLKRLT